MFVSFCGLLNINFACFTTLLNGFAKKYKPLVQAESHASTAFAGILNVALRSKIGEIYDINTVILLRSNS
jgi:hypothetical protein